MTEVERADQIAREPRRRFWQNIAMVLGVVLALALLFLLWYQLQQRADSAETSAVSLAQQVQERCESGGSLDVGDRDLCQQAEDVVQDGPPHAGPAGAQGIQGLQGERGPAGVRGPQGRTGPPGETGPRGPIGPDGESGPRGPQGATGAPGAAGSQGEPGPTGPQGETGTQGIQGPTGLTGPAGADSTIPGPQGPRGPQGTARPGTYTCPDGEYVGGFTISVEGAVTLSCKPLAPPVVGPPTP